MKTRVIILIVVAFLGLGFKSDKPAYKIYNEKGKKVSYSNMLKTLIDADLLFFGELHNNPIAHWLQFELTKDLFQVKEGDLMLGAEMFEADNQLILDEYLKGYISRAKFEDETRLWNNYKTDYKPLLEFAKDSGICFVASNIPRRYASVVFKEGFEGLEKLSDNAKEFIAPLPINYDPELACYKNMLKMGGPMGKEANPNFPKAQAVKDATMAFFILNNWQEGKLLFHFNGSYHSDNFQGIVWHVKQQKPDLKIITITTKLQEKIDKLDEEYLNAANFILVVPESMTTTY